MAVVVSVVTRAAALWAVSFASHPIFRKLAEHFFRDGKDLVFLGVLVFGTIARSHRRMMEEDPKVLAAKRLVFHGKKKERMPGFVNGRRWIKRPLVLMGCTRIKELDHIPE